MSTGRALARLRSLTPDTVVAAAWTVLALWRARRSLRDCGFGARVIPPPRLPRRAGRGVDLVLRRMNRTCLERAVIEQAWLSSHGVRVDVVIGVVFSGGQPKAHAWVDGRMDVEAGQYLEIHRMTPDHNGRREPAGGAVVVKE